VFERYAIPPRRRALYRLAPMPQSPVPAAAGRTQATGGATSDACLGARLQAEQALIRKKTLCMSRPCHRRRGRGAGRTGVPGRCSPAEAHGDHGEALVPRTMGGPT